MSKSKQERRKIARINRRAVVRFRGEGREAEGILYNFSEVGMFVKTDNPLPIGALISIPIQVDKESNIEIQGRVVWSSTPRPQEKPTARGGMGVELSAAPETYLRFVSKMRAQLSQAPRALEERFEVYHRVRFKSGQDFLTEYTENLSRGGMFLATTQRLEPGQTIKAQLEIAGIDEPIEVEGKVAYRLDAKQAEEKGRAAGLGVQFVDLNSEAKARLDHYISRLETHRSRPERRRVEKIPPSGSLKDYLVPELVLGFLQEKQTGTLLIERQGVTKLVYIKDGNPVFVESNLRTETLGQYLVRKGKITPMDLEESLEELAQSDLHHGEIMVQGGMLDSPTLAQAFVEHHEEKLLNMFSWFDGRFEFIPGTDWPPTISILPLKPYRITFQGISRWYDSTLIGAWMGLDEETAIRQIALPPADAGVRPIIPEILKRCATPQTVRKLSAKLQLSVNELLPLIYGMVIAGWVTLDFSNIADVSAPEFKSTLKEEPRALSPESEKVLDLLRRWIKEDFERLRSLNFYELFGVKEDATEAEITRAHMERVSRYASHDIEDIDDKEVREKVQQIHSWLKLAFDTLRDPNLKKLYSRREKKAETENKTKPQIELERQLLVCIRDLEMENMQKAISGLTLASQMYPENRSVQGYLAWALFQQEKKTNSGKASKMLDEAILNDPSDHQLRFYRGQIAMYLNDWRKAERHFSQAVRLHPSFVKAKVALDLAHEKRISEEQSRKT